MWWYKYPVFENWFYVEVVFENWFYIIFFNEKLTLRGWERLVGRFTLPQQKEFSPTPTPCITLT
jgi:hypothetical protein